MGKWVVGTHLSMLPQLYHCMVGAGTPSATQVTKCLFPLRLWSVRSLIWAGTKHRVAAAINHCWLGEKHNLSSVFSIHKHHFQTVGPKNIKHHTKPHSTQNTWERFNLKKRLTLDLQVKGHFLCVISIGNKDSVEALLVCPHPHQGEDTDITEVQEIHLKKIEYIQFPFLPVLKMLTICLEKCKSKLTGKRLQI